MKKDLLIYQSEQKGALSMTSPRWLRTMKREEKSPINGEENKRKFLGEVREGCRKHVRRSLQLWLKVKREEIGSEGPQIKIKIAVPASSLVFPLPDHPPCCSNCTTSDLMSWVWKVLRPVNETVYHCNTLTQYLIEHLFWKLWNKTEKAVTGGIISYI